MKDIILHHRGALEGLSSAEFSHTSKVYNNTWNNLLHGRSALDFIDDPEAIEAGLGYEECNQIMMHNPSAYDKYGNSLHPDKLVAAINKLLVIYNTCGMNLDAPYIIDYYINSIEGLLEQDFEDYKIVLSMYKNSLKCKKVLAQRFGNKISYVFYDEGLLTVNQTFNKTIQLCVEKFGKFEGYFYVDSGITFEGRTDIIKEAYERLRTNKYSIVTIQTDTDAGFNDFFPPKYTGPWPTSPGQTISSEPKYHDYVSVHTDRYIPPDQPTYIYETKFGDVQITGEDFIMPLGGSCHQHTNIYSHDYYKTFGDKILPDVFKGYCVENAFIYCAKAIEKDWVIVKDVQVRHRVGLDGDCIGFRDVQDKFRSGKYWDNLFGDRSSQDWMTDLEAIKYGLGYHNHPTVSPVDRMPHNPLAYDELDRAKYPKELAKILNKYYFLTKEELDYDTIKTKTITEVFESVWDSGGHDWGK
jgi:hypothetical protein